MENKLESTFFETAISNKSYSNKKNLKRHLSYIFRGIELNGKKVLDIGGGTGLLSLWAAVNGSEAICLEPEDDGATHGVSLTFENMKNNISKSLNATLYKDTIQSFIIENKSSPTPKGFDIVVLANTINHINEEAVMNIDSNEAKEFFNFYFNEMFDIINHNGSIIITDCDRNNFFNDIGLKNPLMPTIEWNKHQSPFVWKKFLQNCGFKKIKISWTTPNSFGLIGRILLGNRLAAYFTLSHFKISAHKL